MSEINGALRFVGEPLPGGRALSRFNAKLTVANVAFIGGNEYIREYRVPDFELIQSPGLIEIAFQAPDGSLKRFAVNEPHASIRCVAGEIVVVEDVDAPGEMISVGRAHIEHRLSLAHDGALVIKTDMTGSSRTYFLYSNHVPERYYAKFTRVE